MLGYSLLHIAETRAINKLLTTKAQSGCPVRIAIAAPTSQAVLAADAAQRPPGRLAARIEQARERFAPLAAHAGIEVREHEVATSHTILRIDEQLLLTVHLYGTPGFQAPLLHMRRARDYYLFDQFAKHFEDVWQTAEPLAAIHGHHPTAQTASGGDDGASDPLADLDYVWRPSR
jgi:hypothetical protein